jgi:hypothetical protein
MNAPLLPLLRRSCWPLESELLGDLALRRRQPILGGQSFFREYLHFRSLDAQVRSLLEEDEPGGAQGFRRYPQPRPQQNPKRSRTSGIRRFGVEAVGAVAVPLGRKVPSEGGASIEAVPGREHINRLPARLKTPKNAGV